MRVFHTRERQKVPVRVTVEGDHPESCLEIEILVGKKRCFGEEGAQVGEKKKKKKGKTKKMKKIKTHKRR